MKKRDLILIGSVLLLAAVTFVLVSVFQKEGAVVKVKINGVEIAQYSLSKDGVYILNNGTNILHIENGKAYISDADCPDGLCIRQGKISRTGQTITCLPNKLTVTVYGAGDKTVDIIS